MSQAINDYTKCLPFRHASRAGSREILIGEAGSNLVLSKLQGWGIPAQSAMPGAAYDLVADVADTGLIRIQVKTTTRVINKKCRFQMKRGYYYSRRGTFDYTAIDYEIAAFVFLPLNRVCFGVAPISRFAIPPEWLMEEGVEQKTLIHALNMLKNRRQAALYPAAELDLHKPEAAADTQSGSAGDEERRSSIAHAAGGAL